jgi:hypothetical protein
MLEDLLREKEVLSKKHGKLSKSGKFKEKSKKKRIKV